jgi:hypothetical protein
VVQIQSQASPHGIFGGQSANGTCFSSISLVFPHHHHSTNSPYSFASSKYAYLKDKQARLGTSNKNWGVLNRKVLQGAQASYH